MAQLPEQLLDRLLPAVRNLLEGNSKRELLKKIAATLLVFDDHVVYLESHQSECFRTGGDGLGAASLAAASKALLGSQAREKSVLLLLPPAEFVATTQTMPGVTRESLVSALKLQTQSILPAYSESVAMAVNPSSVEIGDEHTVLWVSNSRMTELFIAFEAAGIFLAAVKPRLLNIQNHATNSIAIDSDRDTMTAVVLREGVIQRWLHVNRLDLEQKEFAQQWQHALANDDCLPVKNFADPASYFEQAENGSNREYSFFPQSALSARKKVEKGRKLIVAAAVVVLFVFMSSIPFVAQSLEFRRWSAALEANRDMSLDARRDQASVVNFENEWGPINDFPQQQVREAMYTLQNVLSPDQLTSLEISEGLIKLQGTSTEPQALLQRLEQDPMFTEVNFSRATNNTRYYIDLRISTVNFEGYMVRYFPDE